MSEYLFVLGRAKELCLAELRSVLTRERIIHHPVPSSPEIFYISATEPLDADYLIRILGGTIKIAEVFGVVKDEDENAIIERLTEFVRCNLKEGEKKINFGLSGYGNFHSNELNHWSKTIKERLEEDQIRSRFLLPQKGLSLSSVVVAKEKLLEIILIKEGRKIILAKTLVVQDFEDWGRRDFGRPAPDPHRGMLPPKVARMMVNLTVGEVILDPFCGVGTILAEGMMLGYKVIGSDQSEEAIEKTKRNLNWFVSNYQISSSKYQIFQCDATHISQKLPPESIDAIVTEPYLGPVVEDRRRKIENGKLRNVILGLEKLYIGCLREWYKILKPDGRVVIALPSFKLTDREFFVKKPIDTCENLGYTLLAGPYQYSRSQAKVVRNIYILEKRYGSH